MDIIPYVTGIIATNTFGEISNEKGNPILQGSPFEQFDRRIFRGYLDEFAKKDDNSDFVIVTGENNFKQMYPVLPINALVIVLNGVDAKVYNVGYKTPSPFGTAPLGTSLMDIFEFVMRLSNRKRIVVLGGRSVYNMFAGHYSHFVHVEACTSQVHDSKKVHVFPEVEDCDVMFPSGKSHLINRGMENFIRVPYDDGNLKVTILDARMENQK